MVFFLLECKLFEGKDYVMFSVCFSSLNKYTHSRAILGTW